MNSSRLSTLWFGDQRVRLYFSARHDGYSWYTLGFGCRGMRHELVGLSRYSCFANAVSVLGMEGYLCLLPH